MKRTSLALSLYLLFTLTFLFYLPVRGNEFNEVEILSNGKPLNYQNRVLVVLDNLDMKNNLYSKLFSLLSNDLKLNLEFKLANDKSIQLFKYGDAVYDHLLIFAPKTKQLGGDLNSLSKLLEFIDKGHNIFVALQSEVGLQSTVLRDLASQCGVEVDDNQTNVIDHFNYDLNLDRNGKHTTLVLDSFNVNVIGSKTLSKNEPVLYDGLGMRLKEKNNLVISILRGSSTSYSYNPNEERVQNEPLVKGRDTVLVGGLQSRNGGRFVISGSIDLFSNKLMETDSINKFNVNGDIIKYSKSGNEKFSKELFKWAFQLKGLLRHNNVHHYLVEDQNKTQPTMYRVSQELIYTVQIQEWNGIQNEWTPYKANDIQLDFVMLHPYQRVNLEFDEKNNYYKSQFKVPDVYGVFKFVIDYRREGYSQLIFSDQVTVRPMKINEFERFIPAAYPYYLSVFVMMGAFVIFIIVFTFTKDKQKSE
ncbi:hypothetical protein ABK040_007315 [Willaertia magna]